MQRDALQMVMISTCRLDLRTALIATGLSLDNLEPVQPRKAIAVAVADSGLQICDMMAAGIFLNATSLLLGATNLVAANVYTCTLISQPRWHACKCGWPVC